MQKYFETVIIFVKYCTIKPLLTVSLKAARDWQLQPWRSASRWGRPGVCSDRSHTSEPRFISPLWKRNVLVSSVGFKSHHERIHCKFIRKTWYNFNYWWILSSLLLAGRAINHENDVIFTKSLHITASYTIFIQLLDNTVTGRVDNLLSAAPQAAVVLVSHCYTWQGHPFPCALCAGSVCAGFCTAQPWSAAPCWNACCSACWDTISKAGFVPKIKKFSCRNVLVCFCPTPPKHLLF